MRVNGPPLSLASIAAVLLLAANPLSAESLWIRDVTIVSPELVEPLSGMQVLVDEGRIREIAAMPSQAARRADRVIDGEGSFLTPGLIDSHVHLHIPGMRTPGMLTSHAKRHPEVDAAGQAQAPRSYLYFGFTTVIDLVGSPAFIAKWNSLEVRPDAYWCGAAPIANGYPTVFYPPKARFRLFPYSLWDERQGGSLPEGVDPKAQAPEAVVARMKAAGAICVKTFYEPGFRGARDWPTPSDAIVSALVDAGQEAGMPVLLHASSEEAQRFALSIGADIIVHGLWNWDDNSAAELASGTVALLDDIVDRGIGYQPTMRVLYGERDLVVPAFLDGPELAHAVPGAVIEWYRSEEAKWFRDRIVGPRGLPEDPLSFNAAPIDRLRQAVRWLAEADARLLFGSDTPSAPIYANPHGLNGLLELRHLAAAGVSPAKLFRAATIDNAVAFGLDGEIGTVAVGKKANLLLLSRNPMESIGAYDAIEAVILQGRLYPRDGLSAMAP